MGGMGFGDLRNEPWCYTRPLPNTLRSGAQALHAGIGACRRRTHSADPQRGSAPGDAAHTSLRTHAALEVSADTRRPTTAHHRLPRSWPDSPPTWARWRCSWKSCRLQGAPSCPWAAAAGSPGPRSAPGSPGSWRTQGPPCTGRWPRSTLCCSHSPGPRARCPAPLLLPGLNGPLGGTCSVSRTQALFLPQGCLALP